MKARAWMAIVLGAGLVGTGCGGDENSPVADAAVAGIDAAGGQQVDAAGGLIDAQLSTIDAAVADVDAAPVSSVIVTPDCDGIAAGDIVLDITNVGASGFTNANATIAVGDIVRFTSTGFHNMISVVGTPAEFAFSSGQAGMHVACLQFNATASIDYRCEIHAAMTGTITVQ